MEQPLIVQAEFSFKGGNNDELCFKKGDLITVTQREEGGWWEGTLNDKTGWFPSNYVNEYKAALPNTEIIRPPEEIQEYRSVVLKDLLDSERAHVAEIQGLLENFLEPLQHVHILNADEYAQLMCNFVEVVRTHDELLTHMEECSDRLGKLFLTKAPMIKQIHQAYCAAHPKAIIILDKFKDELEKYMERQGAATPGLLVLTTGLSKPFRRLDKYSAMLQELERHMESSHPDRGDTQRSVAVYKEIAATCAATRRQKELELQVLTGPVRGWQGPELSSLGDILHMGSVAVGSDKRDRYFVLFPQTLIILSVSQRMSAFIYEGKLPLIGISINRLEDTDAYKNAFEINGAHNERLLACCQGPNEANKWVELLSNCCNSLPLGIKRQLSNLSNSSVNNGSATQPPAHAVPNLDTRGYCTRFTLCAYFATPPYNSYRVTLPPSNYPSTAPYASLSAHFHKLVKNGTLRPQLVKMLLYAQHRHGFDMRGIRMREKKPQRSTAKLKKKTDSKTTEPGSSSGSTERSELERQNAFEIPTDSESEDSICGEFNFSENDDDDEEVYDDCLSNPFEYVNLRGKLRNSNYNSSGTFVDYGPEKQKESLVIGSKALQALAHKSTSTCSIVHTSSAQLRLGADGSIQPDVSKLNVIPTQISAQSESSSVYDARGLNEVYVACEDLANLECPKSDAPDSPTERHSMPNIFVGNRFNNSANTAVYVPSWKDKHEHQNQSAEVHSSSLDLPASCKAAPDKMQAELLYNFQGSVDDLQESDIISPPAMFKQSISSTTKKNPMEASAVACSSVKRSSIKRCISMQYIEMNQTPNQPNNRQTRKAPPPPPPRDKYKHNAEGKCKCCDGSQCPSPRSSDSGMAGSCTIASPDPPNTEAAYYYGGIAQLQLEQDAKRYDICGTFREKFLQKNPIPLRVQARSVLRQPQSTAASNVEKPAENGMFRSGMYAHWWKKEKLPAAVVQGIAVATKGESLSRQSSKESQCSSCQCTFSLTGFSEGGNYCALCQECAGIGSLEGAVRTNTTNTSSFSCPLCSAENTDFPESLNHGVVTTSSTSSSVECAICAQNRVSLLRRQNSFEVEDVNAHTNERTSSAHKRNSFRNRRHQHDNEPTTTAAATAATTATQTEPVIQSSFELQSVSCSTCSTTSTSTSCSSASASTSTSSGSTAATKSAKSSGGSTPKIKFSPDIEQYFEDSKHHPAHKRKERKHKS